MVQYAIRSRVPEPVDEERQRVRSNAAAHHVDTSPPADAAALQGVFSQATKGKTWAENSQNLEDYCDPGPDGDL